MGGLAKAVRGVGGGYQFSADADRVTILTIVELFEEVDGSVNGFDDELAGENPVVDRLQTLATEMNDLARTVLGSISLNNALKGVREGFVLRAQDLEMQKTIIGVAL